jgi:hypothetical protein
MTTPTVGWFVLREKYCWLVADKPSEQAAGWWLSEQVESFTVLHGICTPCREKGPFELCILVGH